MPDKNTTAFLSAAAEVRVKARPGCLSTNKHAVSTGVSKTIVSPNLFLAESEGKVSTKKKQRKEKNARNLFGGIWRNIDPKVDLCRKVFV